MIDNPLWTEKYRPKTVSDTVLPHTLKSTFQSFVDNKTLPNLILAGSAGVGKTTIARAMLEELGCDYIVINGSMNGNIDTLRNEIQQFASTVSLVGGRKYVILDEADYLNPNSTQPALRNFMEEFSKNCGFILTCNFKNRIISPLHSRCSIIDFKLQNGDRPKMASEFFIRVTKILDNENITYDKKVIVEIITKYFPDNRRILNELQRYSVTGNIDIGILSNLGSESLKSLITRMKEKNFTEVRKWISQNLDNDTSIIFRNLYETAHEFLQNPTDIAQLILLLGEYQYKAAFVADQEINLAACFSEIMHNCKFKS
jgi:DNA polymerase III delta prime subunit